MKSPDLKKPRVGTEHQAPHRLRSKTSAEFATPPPKVYHGYAYGIPWDIAHMFKKPDLASAYKVGET